MLSGRLKEQVNKMNKKIIHQGEVYAGAWSRRSENSSGVTDAWLKFYLPDEDALDAMLLGACDDDFRGTKKSGGKLFRITIEEYSDLEETPAEYQEKPQLKLSQMSAVICKDELFNQFCRQFLLPVITEMKNQKLFKASDTNEDKAVKLVRFVCSIESRSELDSNEEAAIQFNQMVRGPFKEFKKQQVKK